MCKKGMPRFMIDHSVEFCAPVTQYHKNKDGTFTSRCAAVPGLTVKGKTFGETVQKTKEAYLTFCMKRIWN